MATSTATLPIGFEASVRAEELKTFEAHKSALLKSEKGKYVLIKGNEIIGLYDQKEDALTEGYQRFQLKGFLVQRVQEEYDTYYIGGSALGITD